MQISTPLAVLPISFLARPRISAAALLVKVMAAICSGGRPAWISRPILCVITRVLPEPEPAQHQAGAVHLIHGFLLGEIEPVDG